MQKFFAVNKKKVERFCLLKIFAPHLTILVLLYFLFLFNHNPLTISLLLLIITFPLIIITTYFSSAWIGLRILLIFSGGIIIIFLYITSLCRNYKFNLKFPLILVTSLPLSVNIYPITLTNSPSNYQFWYFYNLNNMRLFLFILFYLIFTLFFIVIVSQYYDGSLKKYY